LGLKINHLATLARQTTSEMKILSQFFPEVMEKVLSGSNLQDLAVYAYCKAITDEKLPGADPTTVSYNASAVNFFYLH
jgi:hypothetical protein